MIPIKTPWTNIVMGKNQGHVLPCPAHLNTKNGDVTVAFELTKDELKALQKSKIILFKQTTYNKPMQPIDLWIEDSNGKAIKDDRIHE